VTTFLSVPSRVRGCLLGGAVGDALGAPIEFHTWAQIRSMFGPDGLCEVLAPGHFTDDTQMTLFTCEGLLAAVLRQSERGISNPSAEVFLSYQHWLDTQEGRGRETTEGGARRRDSWLASDPRLHRREAPGNTCLSALQSGVAGTVHERINDSKGCGAVMRAAPAGIIPSHGDPKVAYEVGCMTAALTHGHDLAIHSAGLFAAVICRVLGGEFISEAAQSSLELTIPEIRTTIESALELGKHGVPTAEVIESELGGGWVAEEALAIAIACSVAAPDFESGVVASVNHSGDSDSTGSLCGNLLGSALGESAIPTRWLDSVDALDLVLEVANDCVLWVVDRPTSFDADRQVFEHLFHRYGR
jgi:ADP-ribosyl-[dinitrogen reductase] hydrolase